MSLEYLSLPGVLDQTDRLERGPIGEISSRSQETRIAIVGAGPAGLCAAYELMKVGLHPVVFESGRLGGRIFTATDNDTSPPLELGAMRIPTSHRAFQFYKREFGIRTAAFPVAGQVDTLIDVCGTKELWEAGAPAPDRITAVMDKLATLLIPFLSDLTTEDPQLRHKRWSALVNRFKDASFYEVLSNLAEFTETEFTTISAVGTGTGSLEPQLRVSFLEVLRTAVGYWVGEQQVIGGTYGPGLSSLTQGFWQHRTETALGHLSLQDIHQPNPVISSSFRPGVLAIRKTHNRRGVVVLDEDGNTETFAAVIATCSLRALDVGIEIDEELLEPQAWRAVRRMHYVSASRLVCRSHDKFWKGQDICPITLTDRCSRATYLLDYGDESESGACILSDSWGDHSTKLLALSPSQRQKRCLGALDDLYNGQFSKQSLFDFQWVSWDTEPGFHGGFKLTYPGQYEDNALLYQQNEDSLNSGSRDGLFLAGEGVSWAGGWIEGALQTAIRAAHSVVQLIDRQ